LISILMAGLAAAINNRAMPIYGVRPLPGGISFRM